MLVIISLFLANFLSLFSVHCGYSATKLDSECLGSKKRAGLIKRKDVVPHIDKKMLKDAEDIVFGKEKCKVVTDFPNLNDVNFFLEDSDEKNYDKLKAPFNEKPSTTLNSDIKKFFAQMGKYFNENSTTVSDSDIEKLCNEIERRFRDNPLVENFITQVCEQKTSAVSTCRHNTIRKNIKLENNRNSFVDGEVVDSSQVVDNYQSANKTEKLVAKENSSSNNGVGIPKLHKLFSIFGFPANNRSFMIENPEISDFSKHKMSFSFVKDNILPNLNSRNENQQNMGFLNNKKSFAYEKVKKDELLRPKGTNLILNNLVSVNADPKSQNNAVTNKDEKKDEKKKEENKKEDKKGKEKRDDKGKDDKTKTEKKDDKNKNETKDDKNNKEKKDDKTKNKKKEDKKKNEKKDDKNNKENKDDKNNKEKKDDKKKNEKKDDKNNKDKKDDKKKNGKKDDKKKDEKKDDKKKGETMKDETKKGETKDDKKKGEKKDDKKIKDKKSDDKGDKKGDKKKDDNENDEKKKYDKKDDDKKKDEQKKKAEESLNNKNVKINGDKNTEEEISKSDNTALKNNQNEPFEELGEGGKSDINNTTPLDSKNIQNSLNDPDLAKQQINYDEGNNTSQQLPQNHPIELNPRQQQSAPLTAQTISSQPQQPVQLPVSPPSEQPPILQVQPPVQTQQSPASPIQPSIQSQPSTQSQQPTAQPNAQQPSQQPAQPSQTPAQPNAQQPSEQSVQPSQTPANQPDQQSGQQPSQPSQTPANQPDQQSGQQPQEQSKEPEQMDNQNSLNVKEQMKEGNDRSNPQEKKNPNDAQSSENGNPNQEAPQDGAKNQESANKDKNEQNKSKEGSLDPQNDGSGPNKPKDNKSKNSDNKAKLDIKSDSIAPILAKNNFNVSEEQLTSITNKVSENFDNEQEAAMFMAQIMHESGGFMHQEEIACKENPSSCAAQYDDGTGVPGKSYHGRGFIQLSWAENYRAAGEALGLGDKLVQNPELVSEDPEIAMDVAIWYWKERVANQPGYDPNNFGTTTKAINGALECTGQNVDKSKQRYEYYSEIADAMGIEDKASEAGCY